MNKECYGCKANENCSTAVQYGSIMCMAKRMQLNQSKADLIKRQSESKGANEM